MNQQDESKAELWSAESKRFESAEFSDELERAHAVAKWAVETFGDALALTASFQDAIMVNLLRSVKPDIEIVFLDTQYHFEETLTYRDQLTDKLHLNVRTVQPAIPKGQTFVLDAGADACCNARKVEPLREVLYGKSAWLSGIRRAETPERASTPLVAWNSKWNLVKVSPIATWTDEDVERYQRENELPVHPLTAMNPNTNLVYTSIGCEPCTVPLRPNTESRAGRWNGDKTECGLHT